MSVPVNGATVSRSACSATFRAVHALVPIRQTAAVLGVLFNNIDRNHWQVSGQEYELWLSPDSSTNGHTQWYFFSIANGRSTVPYRLHIHNFRKAHSLYSQGLQPLLHSSKEAALTVSCLHATVGF